MRIEATLPWAETGQSPVKSLAPNKRFKRHCSFGGANYAITKLLFRARITDDAPQV